jgi:hypothetical protein
LLEEPAALDERQVRLLALMRTKGLSIKELDEDRKEEVRDFLDYLHNTKGMSLNDVAKLVGNKTSGYTSWLCRQLGVRRRPFEEARLKGIREKRRKYERKPFDGTDEDKAYLLGLRHGDLSVSKPWKGVVSVSTSTTHPAMVELFRTLFEPYGHVYQYPRYKKEVDAYEWNIQAILDDSFSFLSMSFEDSKAWLEGSRARVLAYLSGFLDAEGSILVTFDSRSKAVIFVDFYNEDYALLDWIKQAAIAMGLGCSLRVNKPRGLGTTGYKLFHNRDYWQLSIFSAGRIQAFILELSPRHPEKIARRTLALRVRPRQQYSEIFEDVITLRRSIKKEVQDFVELAKRTFIVTHPTQPVRKSRRKSG